MCQWSFSRNPWSKESFLILPWVDTCLSSSEQHISYWTRGDRASAKWIPAARRGICQWQDTILSPHLLWTLFRVSLSHVLKPLVTLYFLLTNAFTLVDWYLYLKHFPGIWYGKLRVRMGTSGLNISTWARKDFKSLQTPQMHSAVPAF